ncbi:MAG TPA: Na-translocating system protein MpsC family protein [Solirubrobacterales bacterium]|nr:Na-translocating system protein MpsC family protein [Solirubrobacterales bacterium]
MTASNGVPLAGSALTDAISAALVALYAEFYDHERTTATTYINDNVVVCVLEDILSSGESSQVAEGAGKNVIDGRIAFQEGAQDEFTKAIERLTDRRVTAFLSANQTNPGIACELFFLEAPPGAA